MKFKNREDRELFTMLSPILIMIYSDLNWYAKLRHNVDLVITATSSTIEKDKMLGRVSSSHREKRALDIRTKDIDAFIVQDLVQYINNKPEYKKYHYLSNGGAKRLAYLHTTNAPHIHLAIHSQFAIKSE